MQCSDVQKRLKASHIPSALADDPLLCEHLGGCDECRDYAEDLRIQRLLRSLPAPRPDDGFADRALDQAWRRGAGSRPERPVRVGRGLAIAATLLLAVLVGLVAGPWYGDRNTEISDIQVVHIPAHEVGKVRVVLNSRRALSNATITVNLDEPLRLDGYPNTRTLRWQTAIKEGKNMLELPVRLLPGESGYLSIDIESEGARKQMKLALKSREEKPEATLLI